MGPDRLIASALLHAPHPTRSRGTPVSVGAARLAPMKGGGDVSKGGKPSKAALSKAGKTLASDSSSKSQKSDAGKTLGKG